MPVAGISGISEDVWSCIINEGVMEQQKEHQIYFSLSEHSFLVKGFTRGAIYDLESGDVYSIDKDSIKLIDQLEQGININAVNLTNNVSTNDLISYLDQLAELKLGAYVDCVNNKGKYTLKDSHSTLDFIWLEITNNCNLKCLHCYNACANRSTNNELSLERWRRILCEGRDLGCRSCQFIGGEPFIRYDDLLELIKYAKDISYEFCEIFTNAMYIDDKAITIIKDLNINIAVSVYGYNAAIHDNVTSVTGSFNKTISNIKAILSNSISPRVAIIVMKNNYEYLEKTIQFLREEVGVTNISYDFVRPSGRGCSTDLFTEKIIDLRQLKQPSFRKIDRQSFIKRKNGHNCFANSLCVTSIGDVVPCIMVRNKIIGNIRDRSLIEVFYGKEAAHIRCLSKDLIDICKDCEFRYVCFDCRVDAPQDNFFAKPLSCLYDPYTGEWQQRKEVK